MGSGKGAAVRIRHALPGRLRVHLPALSRQQPFLVERQLRRLKGVRSVRFNPLTDTFLIQFNPEWIGQQFLLKSLHQAVLASRAPEYGAVPSLPNDLVALGQQQGNSGIAGSQQQDLKPVPFSRWVAAIRLFFDIRDLLKIRNQGDLFSRLLARGQRPSPLRQVLDQLFGSAFVDLVFHTLKIVTQVLAGNPVGLALALGEAFLWFLTLPPSLSFLA